MELCSVDSTEDLTSGKPETSASVLEPLLSEPRVQVENKDICSIKTAEATMDSGNGLTELDWQQIERSDVCPSPSEPVSFNDVPTLTNITEVPVDVSKENHDFRTDEEGLTSEQRPTMDREENIKSGNKQITSETGLEPTPVSTDTCQQNPNLLDLVDAAVIVFQYGNPDKLCKPLVDA